MVMYLSVLSIFIYHTSHSCDYEKALQLRSVYKKPNFVLQVTPESISGTTKLYRKKIMLLLALLLMLHTRNNTDGNKLVIFSSIRLYYGDTSVMTHVLQFKFHCCT